MPQIAAVTGHSLKDVEAILDAHYRGRDIQLAEAAVLTLEARATIEAEANLRFQMSLAIASRSAFDGTQRFSRSHFSRFSFGERSTTVPDEGPRLARSRCGLSGGCPSGPPWNTEASQPQLPRFGSDGQPPERPHLALDGLLVRMQ